MRLAVLVAAPCLSLVPILGALLGACGATSPGPGPTDATEAVAQPAVASACGGVAGRALEAEPTELLRDHLRMRLVAGLEEAPPPPGLPATHSGDEEEATLLISTDHGPAFGVVVTELFRSPGEDLGASAISWLGEPARALAPLEGVSPIDVLFGEAEPTGRGTMVLVARAVVATEDGLVQHVAFFAPRDVIENEDEGAEPCIAVARAMAETLRPGERRVALTGGPLRLTPRIRMDLSPGYAPMHQVGPDFEVRYFYRLAPLGAPHAQLGVYLGHSPRSHVGEVLEMRRVAGALLGQSVSWRAWTSAQNGQRVSHMETMIEVPGGEGLWAHVFFVTEEPGLVDELKSMAETLSLVDPEAE